MSKKKTTVKEIEENGTIISSYPVDESQDVSNAGNATLYKYKGGICEIIEWNELAIEHKQGKKEIFVSSPLSK